MMTISPHHKFSTTNCLNWLLEDPISQESNNLFFYESRGETTSDGLDHQQPFMNINNDVVIHQGNNNNINKTVVKKLNHNASERDRRKKINTLFSNLRSLLPSEDQSKKLSIPATVTRALKYIPELQKEVRRLNQKKESFITKSLMRVNHQKGKKGNDQTNSKLAVSAIQINDREIVLQCSMPKTSNSFLSEAIEGLEEEGFVVLSASCFQPFNGRVFNNLLLQAPLGGRVMDAEKVKEKLLSFL